MGRQSWQVCLPGKLAHTRSTLQGASLTSHNCNAQHLVSFVVNFRYMLQKLGTCYAVPRRTLISLSLPAEASRPEEWKSTENTGSLPFQIICRVFTLMAICRFWPHPLMAF